MGGFQGFGGEEG